MSNNNNNSNKAIKEAIGNTNMNERAKILSENLSNESNLNELTAVAATLTSLAQESLQNVNKRKKKAIPLNNNNNNNINSNNLSHNANNNFNNQLKEEENDENLEEVNEEFMNEQAHQHDEANALTIDENNKMNNNQNLLSENGLTSELNEHLRESAEIPILAQRMAKT